MGHLRAYFRRQEAFSEQQAFFGGLSQRLFDRLQAFPDGFLQQRSQGRIAALHAVNDNGFGFPCYLSQLCQLAELVIPGTAGRGAFFDVLEMAGQVDQDPVCNCRIDLAHTPAHVLNEPRIHSIIPIPADHGKHEDPKDRTK